MYKHRRNPSQLAEEEAKTIRPQTRAKKLSRFERGIQDTLDTPETLISTRKHRSKSAKGSKGNVKATHNLKDSVKSKPITEDSAKESASNKEDKCVSSKAVSGKEQNVGFGHRPLRPFSGERPVRPGSEDSVSSVVRQERERLSSRKDSSYSTYIEITHNESEDLIVVENAESDWSDEVIQEERIPEGNVNLETETKESKLSEPPSPVKTEPVSRRKRRPRSKKKPSDGGHTRPKSANDKDEMEEKRVYVQLMTEEVVAEPVYVPHSIWVVSTSTTQNRQWRVPMGFGPTCLFFLQSIGFIKYSSFHFCIFPTFASRSATHCSVLSFALSR